MVNNVALTAPGYGKNIWDLLVLVFVFILIIVACYYSTKWVSRQGLNIQKAKNIKVLEVFRLNQASALYIVKIGDKVMSLGVTKDHIEFLTDLNEDSLEFNEIQKKQVNFKELLNMYKDKKEE